MPTYADYAFLLFTGWFEVIADIHDHTLFHPQHWQ